MYAIALMKRGQKWGARNGAQQRRLVFQQAAALSAHSFLTNRQKYVTIWSHMKDDDLTPVWGALTDPTRRTILDVTKSKEEQHENQTDQRVCGRPGEGTA